MRIFKLLSFLSFMLITAYDSLAQAPGLINYQAVARNATGAIIASQPVSIRITIHDGTITGTVQYQETQNITTNIYGLFNLQVGAGTAVSGSMSSITWASGGKYMQIEIDPAGGSAYVNMGAQQLVSVPYALYAASGGTVYTAGTAINISGTSISAQNTAALWNASELRGVSISATSPTTGQVLSFNGTDWSPLTLSSGGIGTVTSITAGSGLAGGIITTSGAISMPNVGTPGTYGSATQVPVITTDAQGRIINVVNTAITSGGSGTVTSINTTAPLTGGPIITSGTISMSTSGVTAGSYGTASQIPQITIDAFGRVTGATTIAVAGSSGWGLIGNAGTTAGTNFIGTTDAQGLLFKVNNQLAGKIDITAYSSTSFGYQSLNSNTVNSNNAFGCQSLYANTTGSGNNAFGTYALYSNLTGSNNSAFGFQSLYANTASYNTGLGYQTLYQNTTGTQNTAIGSQALISNTTGSQNTFVQSTSAANTTGSHNTAIGWAALFNNQTGSYNTALGNTADMAGCCINLSNTMALGYNATVTNSNTIVIGNSSITSISAQVGLTVVSDARVKNNIRANVPGLTFISALKPVTYNYDITKENELLGIKDDTAKWIGKYDIEKISFSGFLAQDVDATAKLIGYDFSGVDKSHAMWGIKYTEFIPAIVQAEQELNIKIELQQKTIKSQGQKIGELENQVKELIVQINEHKYKK